MVFRITEYGGFQSGRPFSASIPVGPAIQTQVVTLGSSVSTQTLSGATRMIMVDSDAGALMFLGSSASTGVPQAGSSTAAVGSTGGGGGTQRIPANVAPMVFFVQPYMRLCTLST